MARGTRHYVGTGTKIASWVTHRLGRGRACVSTRTPYTSRVHGRGQGSKSGRGRGRGRRRDKVPIQARVVEMECARREGDECDVRFDVAVRVPAHLVRAIAGRHGTGVLPRAFLPLPARPSCLPPPPPPPALQLVPATVGALPETWPVSNLAWPKATGHWPQPFCHSRVAWNAGIYTEGALGPSFLGPFLFGRRYCLSRERGRRVQVSHLLASGPLHARVRTCIDDSATAPTSSNHLLRLLSRIKTS